MKKVLFIANGQVCRFGKNFFNNFDEIVCVDGGYNSTKLYGISPTFLIGDLDSAKVEKTELDKACKVVFKDNQDESDLEFAIKYILKNVKDVAEITIINATGLRLDHTINNIILLKSIDKRIIAKIVSENEELYLVRDTLILENVSNKTLSILPITDIKNIKTHGLKWELDGVDISFGFVGGISNVCLEDRIKISLESGEILVVLNKGVV